MDRTEAALMSKVFSVGALRSALAALESGKGRSLPGRSSTSGAGDGGPSGSPTPAPVFERDEASFHAAVEEMVRLFGRALVRQVCATRSAVHAAALLHAVAALPIVQRPALADVVAALHGHVLQLFSNELDAIQGSLRDMLDAGGAATVVKGSDLFRNWPPLAAKLAYCRSCKTRVAACAALVRVEGAASGAGALAQRAERVSGLLDIVEQR